MGEQEYTNGISLFRGTGYDDWQFGVQTQLVPQNLVDVLIDEPPSEAVAKTDLLKRDKRTKKRTFIMIAWATFLTKRRPSRCEKIWRRYLRRSLLSIRFCCESS